MCLYIDRFGFAEASILGKHNVLRREKMEIWRLKGAESSPIAAPDLWDMF